PAVFARRVELVDRMVFRLERGGLDAAAYRPEPGPALGQQVGRFRRKTEGLQRQDRQQRTEGARGLVELVPERVGAGEQAQLVLGPEDEIVVRIRADADARRCRAKASE